MERLIHHQQQILTAMFCVRLDCHPPLNIPLQVSAQRCLLVAHLELATALLLRC
jgi:hypothetical protein